MSVDVEPEGIAIPVSMEIICLPMSVTIASHRAEEVHSAWRRRVAVVCHTEVMFRPLLCITTQLVGAETLIVADSRPPNPSAPSRPGSRTMEYSSGWIVLGSLASVLAQVSGPWPASASASAAAARSYLRRQPP